MGCVVNALVAGGVKTRRMEMYTGVTNGSGVYAVTYPTSFIQPMVLVSMPNSDTETIFQSTGDGNGFSITAVKRTTLTVLSLNVLSFATTPVIGVAMAVMVIEGQG